MLDLLDLEDIEVNLFRGGSPKERRQRVFGGQVLGQALIAAGRTVEDEDRSCHSFHAYFLRPGDPKVPIVYEVDRIRDGRSFTTRRVVAVQHGRAIFSMAASFQVAEDGLEHQFDMPDVPPPENLENQHERRLRVAHRLPEERRDWFLRERPIEVRPVEPHDLLEPAPQPPHENVWIRTTGPLPDDPRLQQCVLAYASDMTLLETCTLPHGISWLTASMQVASLDHAMWFHRPFRADEWMLYAQDSPSSSAGRGFNRGSIFDREGRLVASVVQEGLIRRRGD
jgi:acyl-CoA thioesterase-2